MPIQNEHSEGATSRAKAREEAALRGFVPATEIARHFGVHRNTALNWPKRFDDYPTELTFRGWKFVNLEEVEKWYRERFGSGPVREEFDNFLSAMDQRVAAQ